MKTEDNSNSYETGSKVWEALASQFEEGRGFLGGALNSLRRYVRKHFLSYLLFGIVCGAIAAGAWFLKPQLSEASMTVSYVHYEKKIYADMLEKLNQLIRSGDYPLLSEYLDIPVESVKGYGDYIKGSISGKDADFILQWNKRQAYIGLGNLLAAAAEAVAESGNPTSAE